MSSSETHREPRYYNFRLQWGKRYTCDRTPVAGSTLRSPLTTWGWEALTSGVDATTTELPFRVKPFSKRTSFSWILLCVMNVTILTRWWSVQEKWINVLLFQELQELLYLFRKLSQWTPYSVSSIMCSRPIQLCAGPQLNSHDGTHDAAVRRTPLPSQAPKLATIQMYPRRPSVSYYKN